MLFTTMTRYHQAEKQKIRRHSFPPQKNITVAEKLPAVSPAKMIVHKDDLSTVLDPALILHETDCPLTEENLAIHTRRFPPCKDARRHNAELFVANQIPVLEMELQLEKEREKEIMSYVPILSDDLSTPQTKTIQFTNPFNENQRTKKKKHWIKRLTQWITRPDDKNEKRRHFSWSAGTEKEKAKHHTIENTSCQERDSGISINQKRRSSFSIYRSSKITSIPISRQPMLSPPQKEEEFVSLKYPQMMRRHDNNHAQHCAALKVCSRPLYRFSPPSLKYL